MSNQQHRNWRRKFVYTFFSFTTLAVYTRARQNCRQASENWNDQLNNWQYDHVKSLASDRTQKTTFGCELVLQLLVAENHGQKLTNVSLEIIPRDYN